MSAVERLKPPSVALIVLRSPSFAKNAFFRPTAVNRFIACRYFSLPLQPHVSADLSQRWTGTHFAGTSLGDLGALFQLGHNHGISCDVPSSPIPLTVFDVSSVHTISISYCECKSNSSAVPPRVQLLRARWFPATWQRPSTAFTFSLLNLLHKLQSTCKVNLYDFHGAIISMSDNAGLGKPLVSGRPTIYVYAQLTHAIYSSGITSYPWYSVYTYTCANSDEAAVLISLGGSPLFQRAPWQLIAQLVRTLVGTSSYQGRNC